MGVKHFFIWLNNNFKNCIKEIPLKTPVLDVTINNLCIDLNGVFHPCAQQVYEYGDYKRKERLLKVAKKRKFTLKHQMLVFQKVCQRIDYYRKLTQPTKRIILCIDGIAGSAKMSQQRQRRYKSAKERDFDFDPNCMTPGTMFMNYMSKYIDWYIRSMISYHPDWEHLEVVFSNEKVPGEGEHKIINYMRNHGIVNESFCIQGLDADLIMLGLGVPINNVYILRENYHKSKGFLLIDIAQFRTELFHYMKWQDEESKSFRKENAINDFIFMCFLVGNDFLPTIPTLAILEGGIDVMLDVYKTLSKHLTSKKRNGTITLRIDNLQKFIGTLAQYEKGLIVEKANKSGFFPDPIVKKHMIGMIDINYEGYKKEYYAKKFGDVSIKEICHGYLYGMQWVINYYKHGIPDWTWQYMFNYGPFLDDLTREMKSYKFTNFEIHEPVTSFEQLLAVLPPKSKNLVPKIFWNLFENKELYPDDFEVDLSGKRREWEGIVVLPKVDMKVINEEYMRLKSKLDKRDNYRNIRNKSYRIVKQHHSYLFRSFYGDILECQANREIIEL